MGYLRSSWTTHIATPTLSSLCRRARSRRVRGWRVRAVGIPVALPEDSRQSFRGRRLCLFITGAGLTTLADTLRPPWASILTDMGMQLIIRTVFLFFFPSLPITHAVMHISCFIYREMYEKYCEAMSRLSMTVMELLGMSLEVGRRRFVDFFQDHDSIMRLNHYPRCQTPNLTLGTGPHCDPTSLTILHQDDVCGLQVFHNKRWLSIPPRKDALVVNIGDTFMVSDR